MRTRHTKCGSAKHKAMCTVRERKRSLAETCGCRCGRALANTAEAARHCYSSSAPAHRSITSLPALRAVPPMHSSDALCSLPFPPFGVFCPCQRLLAAVCLFVCFFVCLFVCLELVRMQRARRSVTARVHDVRSCRKCGRTRQAGRAFQAKHEALQGTGENKPGPSRRGRSG